jgi:hypothetical protein
MSFMFATCERHRALEFLKALYPSHVVEDTKESWGRVLDCVERDEIRVQDPAFHDPCEIVPGTNWANAFQCEIIALCKMAHEDTVRKKEASECAPF